MKKCGIIYMLVFPNKKVYIGQTIRGLQERVAQHKEMAKQKSDNGFVYNSKIFRAIRKHKKFETQILHENVIRCDLDYLEIFEIGRYNSCSGGYNSTLGGGGISGWHHTEETKKRIGSYSDGHKNPVARFTKKQVKKMREDFDPINGPSVRDLSKKYKADYSTIHDIIMNKSYVDDEYFPPSTVCKVTLEQRQEIFKKYVEGYYTQQELSEKYGVSRSRIRYIIKEQTDKDFSCRSYNRKSVRLNQEKARQIREKRAAGLTNRELAREYGVAESTVSAVICGRIWVHEK